MATKKVSSSITGTAKDHELIARNPKAVRIPRTRTANQATGGHLGNPTQFKKVSLAKKSGVHGA